MNYYIVVLVVVIVIILYVLYRYFKNSGKRLTANVDLNKTNHTPIPITDTSTRFAYGVWIYVNSWDTKADSKHIFYRSVLNQPHSFRLILDKNNPILYVDLSQNKVGSSTVATEQIPITTNFPMQKWCYVCISVDGKYVDCYLDGKLVKSVLLQDTVKTPGSSDVINIGSTTDKNDILLAGFYHWTHPLTPQDVWEKYSSGNGGNFLSNLIASIGVRFSIFKNNVEEVNIRMF
jgi:hypothetical protein